MKEKEKQEFYNLLLILKEGNELMIKQWGKTVKKFTKEWERIVEGKGENEKRQKARGRNSS